MADGSPPLADEGFASSELAVLCDVGLDMMRLRCSLVCVRDDLHVRAIYRVCTWPECPMLV